MLAVSLSSVSVGALCRHSASEARTERDEGENECEAVARQRGDASGRERSGRRGCHQAGRRKNTGNSLLVDWIDILLLMQL